MRTKNIDNPHKMKMFSIKLPLDLYKYVEDDAEKSYSSKAQVIIKALLLYKKQNIL